jgi:hypothetical protein
MKIGTNTRSAELASRVYWGILLVLIHDQTERSAWAFSGLFSRLHAMKEHSYTTRGKGVGPRAAPAFLFPRDFEVDAA